MLRHVSGLLVLLVLTESKFYPVDLTNFTTNGNPDPYKTADPDYFRQWLRDWLNPAALEVFHNSNLADWDFNTNITDESEAGSVQQSNLSANFTNIAAKMASTFQIDKMPPDEQLQRIYKALTILGNSALPPSEFEELTTIINNMSSTYSTVVLCFDTTSSVQTLQDWQTSGTCPADKQTVFDPPIFNYMDTVFNDTDRRLYLWKTWKEVSGRPVRAEYQRYIDLKNKAAQLSGYADNGQLWRSNYVVDSLNYTDAAFLDNMDNLWQQLKPFYLQLHAYMRRILINKFPNANISATGPIPAHLLGDTNSQDWTGMLSFTQPFLNQPLLDVTTEMQAQGYTVERMFRLSATFQEDLGLIPMPDTFWNRSMFVRPTDRDVVCHASSWDFLTSFPDDTRIKMCTLVNMPDLITIHHEMGHSQYFLQYTNQSVLFRDGANSGFHEAVGDTLALSVRTPKHLALIGLNKNNTDDQENNLNFLYQTALEKVANLPFLYLMDRYRYDVFSGKISKDNLNSGWWKYLTDYQGISSPVPRSEVDFDPGAKFHIVADVEYMRYFISFIIQFQFHKALCQAAGQTGPLYQCDINGSKAAGKLLGDMLSLGSSQPWPVAMQRITGSQKMDAGPLLEYFDPLYKYLQTFNAKNNEMIGWNTLKKPGDNSLHHIMLRNIISLSECLFVCLVLVPKASAKFHPVDLSDFLKNGVPDKKQVGSEDHFREWLQSRYNPIAQKVLQEDSLSQWEYNTNITDEEEANTVKQAQLSANFSKIVAKMVQNFQVEKLKDLQLKRLHKMLTEIGDHSLEEADITELTSIVNHMNTVYNTATICFNATRSVETLESLTKSGCPKELQTAVEPVLNKYAENAWDDPAKRKYLWKSWRDASGKQLRDNYTRYIDLKNKAARLSGYPDAGALWRAHYVVDSLNYTDAVFLTELDDLWQQIRPLYLQLFTYVRRKLIQHFPKENLSATGPVPAHLLGDLLSQYWAGMLNFTQLFPAKPLLDVTAEMKAQNYTVEKMYRLSEQFQTGLGLKPMPASFWNLSLLSKPEDGRKVVCFASSWDFLTNSPDDTRIKMCTQIDMSDLLTVHHEMGHSQYYLQYEDQTPVNFRDGANNGFHEAVGDTLALSVATPKHLAWLGLLKNNSEDEESALNHQFATALDKIANLPFLYLMDRYRYDVFSGKIPQRSLNAGWWKYVKDYQGVVAPFPRSESDFDPGAKFHIDADVEYMRYFISFVIQFQFHKALCKAAGYSGPLYQCDINESKAAGKLFSDMLSLGSSQPWPVAMERITGSPKMDAAALLEYFDPLHKYLQKINAENKELIGWK
ncbi:angiotensin-converting enzyme-like [Paramacrobiotus metropolitanus]|uniref:angiotensin-converting enzyme-like n=1 Tax=Paramacrobiotus metropolitanus TaxID=2943436 RepID=UPI002445831A|nr:angiotensin-converting enzyme-like [Paramacrobiotus metropolitanus]